MEIDITKSVIFFSIAIITLLFAFLSIFAKRIVYSLIFAIIVFFCLAVIFFLLGADYNSIIQVAIYGVTIPILFTLALMFTSPKIDTKIFTKISPRFYVVFFALGLLFLCLTYLISVSLSLNSSANWLLQKQTLEINTYQMFKALSDGLFTNYVVPFEIFSLLLLIILIGLSTLNLKGDNTNDK